jgi:hypothetical protein
LEIELPDGTILDAPDDADVKRVVAGYQRQRELADIRERARISYSALPAAQRTYLGYARPFVELGLGVKDLAGKAGIGGGLTDDDRAKLEQLEQVHGGAGTAARIGGEVVTFAGPGGGAIKVLELAPRAAAKFLPRVATDAAVSAGVEAIKAPTENTSRGERAARGAAGAGVGHVLTRTLGALVRGLRPTREAAQLLAENIPLTVGMAKGGALQQIEQQLAKVPIIGGAIRKRQQEALEAWNRQLLNRVMPEGETAFAGHQGFKDATTAFKQSYEKLWSNPINLSLRKLQDLWGKTAIDAQQTLAPDLASATSAKLYKMFTETLVPANGREVSGAAVSKIDDELRHEAILAARRGMGDQAQLLSQARQQLRSLLPEGVSAELGRIDGLYAQFIRLRRAAGYKGAAANGGTFTPDQLLGAATALDKSAGKGATARGEALMQPEATAAQQVLGTVGGKPPGPLENAALALGSVAALPATLTGRAAYSAPMQRYATGQTEWQQVIDSLFNNSPAPALIDALRRRGVTPGTVGAAVEEPNDRQ